MGKTLRIPIFVFGPETHMTAIVGMALGKKPIPTETEMDFVTANFLLPGGHNKVSFINVASVICINVYLLLIELPIKKIQGYPKRMVQ